jgi:hypothetical protein
VSSKVKQTYNKVSQIVTLLSTGRCAVANVVKLQKMELYMANNLFISYDLNSPGQDYSSVINEIKSLGSWAKIQKSHWYVNSALTATQAVDQVWAKMDSNDSLIVIDATNNNASWQNLSEDVAIHIKNSWVS